MKDYWPAIFNADYTVYLNFRSRDGGPCMPTIVAIYVCANHCKQCTHSAHSGKAKSWPCVPSQHVQITAPGCFIIPLCTRNRISFLMRNRISFLMRNQMSFLVRNHILFLVRNDLSFLFCTENRNSRFATTIFLEIYNLMGFTFT